MDKIRSKKNPAQIKQAEQNQQNKIKHLKEHADMASSIRAKYNNNNTPRKPASKGWLKSQPQPLDKALQDKALQDKDAIDVAFINKHWNNNPQKALDDISLDFIKTYEQLEKVTAEHSNEAMINNYNERLTTLTELLQSTQEALLDKSPFKENVKFINKLNNIAFYPDEILNEKNFEVEDGEKFDAAAEFDAAIEAVRDFNPDTLRNLGLDTARKLNANKQKAEDALNNKDRLLKLNEAKQGLKTSLEELKKTPQNEKNAATLAKHATTIFNAIAVYEGELNDQLQIFEKLAQDIEKDKPNIIVFEKSIRGFTGIISKILQAVLSSAKFCLVTLPKTALKGLWAGITKCFNLATSKYGIVALSVLGGAGFIGITPLSALWSSTLLPFLTAKYAVLASLASVYGPAAMVFVQANAIAVGLPLLGVAGLSYGAMKLNSFLNKRLEALQNSNEDIKPIKEHIAEIKTLQNLLALDVAASVTQGEIQTLIQSIKQNPDKTLTTESKAFLQNANSLLVAKMIWQEDNPVNAKRMLFPLLNPTINNETIFDEGDLDVVQTQAFNVISHLIFLATAEINSAQNDAAKKAATEKLHPLLNFISNHGGLHSIISFSIETDTFQAQQMMHQLIQAVDGPSKLPIDIKMMVLAALDKQNQMEVVGADGHKKVVQNPNYTAALGFAEGRTHANVQASVIEALEKDTSWIQAGKELESTFPLVDYAITNKTAEKFQRAIARKLASHKWKNDAAYTEYALSLMSNLCIRNDINQNSDPETKTAYLAFFTALIQERSLDQSSLKQLQDKYPVAVQLGLSDIGKYNLNVKESQTKIKTQELANKQLGEKEAQLQQLNQKLQREQKALQEHQKKIEEQHQNKLKEVGDVAKKAIEEKEAAVAKITQEQAEIQKQLIALKATEEARVKLAEARNNLAAQMVGANAIQGEIEAIAGEIDIIQNDINGMADGEDKNAKGALLAEKNAALQAKQADLEKTNKAIQELQADINKLETEVGGDYTKDDLRNANAEFSKKYPNSTIEEKINEFEEILKAVAKARKQGMQDEAIKKAEEEARIAAEKAAQAKAEAEKKAKADEEKEVAALKKEYSVLLADEININKEDEAELSPLEKAWKTLLLSTNDLWQPVPEPADLQLTEEDEIKYQKAIKAKAFNQQKAVYDVIRLTHEFSKEKAAEAAAAAGNNVPPAAELSEYEVVGLIIKNFALKADNAKRANSVIYKHLIEARDIKIKEVPAGQGANDERAEIQKNFNDHIKTLDGLFNVIKTELDPDNRALFDKTRLYLEKPAAPQAAEAQNPLLSQELAALPKAHKEFLTLLNPKNEIWRMPEKPQRAANPLQVIDKKKVKEKEDPEYIEKVEAKKAEQSAALTKAINALYAEYEKIKTGNNNLSKMQFVGKLINDLNPTNENSWLNQKFKESNIQGPDENIFNQIQAHAQNILTSEANQYIENLYQTTANGKSREQFYKELQEALENNKLDINATVIKKNALVKKAFNDVITECIKIQDTFRKQKEEVWRAEIQELLKLHIQNQDKGDDANDLELKTSFYTQLKKYVENELLKKADDANIERLKGYQGIIEQEIQTIINDKSSQTLSKKMKGLIDNLWREHLQKLGENVKNKYNEEVKFYDQLIQDLEDSNSVIYKTIQREYAERVELCKLLIKQSLPSMRCSAITKSALSSIIQALPAQPADKVILTAQPAAPKPVAVVLPPQGVPPAIGAGRPPAPPPLPAIGAGGAPKLTLLQEYLKLAIGNNTMENKPANYQYSLLDGKGSTLLKSLYQEVLKIKKNAYPEIATYDPIEVRKIIAEFLTKQQNDQQPDFISQHLTHYAKDLEANNILEKDNVTEQQLQGDSEHYKKVQQQIQQQNAAAVEKFRQAIEDDLTQAALTLSSEKKEPAASQTGPSAEVKQNSANMRSELVGKLNKRNTEQSQQTTSKKAGEIKQVVKNQAALLAKKYDELSDKERNALKNFIGNIQDLGNIQVSQIDLNDLPDEARILVQNTAQSLQNAVINNEALTDTIFNQLKVQVAKAYRCSLANKDAVPNQAQLAEIDNITQHLYGQAIRQYAAMETPVQAKDAKPPILADAKQLEVVKVMKHVVDLWKENPPLLNQNTAKDALRALFALEKHLTLDEAISTATSNKNEVLKEKRRIHKSLLNAIGPTVSLWQDPIPAELDGKAYIWNQYQKLTTLILSNNLHERNNAIQVLTRTQRTQVYQSLRDIPEVTALLTAVHNSAISDADKVMIRQILLAAVIANSSEQIGSTVAFLDTNIQNLTPEQIHFICTAIGKSHNFSAKQDESNTKGVNGILATNLHTKSPIVLAYTLCWLEKASKVNNNYAAKLNEVREKNDYPANCTIADANRYLLIAELNDACLTTKKNAPGLAPDLEQSIGARVTSLAGIWETDDGKAKLLDLLVKNLASFNTTTIGNSFDYKEQIIMATKVALHKLFEANILTSNPIFQLNNQANRSALSAIEYIALNTTSEVFEKLIPDAKWLIQDVFNHDIALHQDKPDALINHLQGLIDNNTELEYRIGRATEQNFNLQQMNALARNSLQKELPGLILKYIKDNKETLNNQPGWSKLAATTLLQACGADPAQNTPENIQALGLENKAQLNNQLQLSNWISKTLHNNALNIHLEARIKEKTEELKKQQAISTKQNEIINNKTELKTLAQGYIKGLNDENNRQATQDAIVERLNNRQDSQINLLGITILNINDPDWLNKTIENLSTRIGWFNNEIQDAQSIKGPADLNVNTLTEEIKTLKQQKETPTNAIITDATQILNLTIADDTLDSMPKMIVPKVSNQATKGKPVNLISGNELADYRFETIAQDCKLAIRHALHSITSADTKDIIAKNLNLGMLGLQFIPEVKNVEPDGNCFHESMALLDEAAYQKEIKFQDYKETLKTAIAEDAFLKVPATIHRLCSQMGFDGDVRLYTKAEDNNQWSAELYELQDPQDPKKLVSINLLNEILETRASALAAAQADNATAEIKKKADAINKAFDDFNELQPKNALDLIIQSGSKTIIDELLVQDQGGKNPPEWMTKDGYADTNTIKLAAYIKKYPILVLDMQPNDAELYGVVNAILLIAQEQVQQLQMRNEQQRTEYINDILNDENLGPNNYEAVTVANDALVKYEARGQIRNAYVANMLNGNAFDNEDKNHIRPIMHGLKEHELKTPEELAQYVTNITQGNYTQKAKDFLTAVQKDPKMCAISINTEILTAIRAAHQDEVVNKQLTVQLFHADGSAGHVNVDLREYKIAPKTPNQFNQLGKDENFQKALNEALEAIKSQDKKCENKTYFERLTKRTLVRMGRHFSPVTISKFG